MPSVLSRFSVPATSFVGVVLALALWQSVATALDGLFILASPVAVTRYIADNHQLLFRALMATLHSAAIGYLFGNLAAIVLACLAIVVPRLETSISFIALLIFCLPLVATGPILRVIFGPGIGPQTMLAALAVYYTTFVPLLVGLRAAPATWLDLIESYGHGPWHKLIYVRLWASIPYLVAGLQIAAPAAFLGAMVGEFTGAQRGMGVLCIQAMRSLDVNATWALALIASAVAIAVYVLTGWLGRMLWPGKPPLILSARSQAKKATVLQNALTFVLTGIFMLAAWQFSMDWLGLNAFFAKRPGDIWAYLATHEMASSHRAELFSALFETLSYTLPGYVAGLLLGAVLAVIFVISPAFSNMILPIAIALRSIPIVTTAPLIVLALGRGNTGIIAIVAIMIFFPTLVTCIQGLRQMPGQVLDVFESYGASAVDKLLLARVPAMLPALFASARIAVPTAILAVTVAEWLATGTGIGNVMALTASTSNYNKLWGAVVLMTLFSFLFYLLVGFIEQKVLAIYAPEQVKN